jgi:hypothetical protein
VRRLSPTVLAAVGLALALLAPGPGAGAPERAPSLRPNEGPPGPSVVVSPSSWWMETGSNVTLASTWNGVPPNCVLTPSWYRWSIAPGGADGTLGSTNGSTVTFSAETGASGTTGVVVRSSAVLRCPGSSTAVEAAATANVAVASPLTLRDLSVAPDPIVPGSTVTLDGEIVGGDPPYRLRTNWGDGNTTTLNVSAAGAFAATRAYRANGSFSVEVTGEDAAGLRAQAAVPERVNVSDGFVAAVEPSVAVAEVGVPVTFSVGLLDAPGNLSTLFGCADSSSLTVVNGSGPTYVCAFGRAGPSYVSFEGVGARPPFPVAYASLEEPVVPPPSVVIGPAPPGEVGSVAYAPIVVGGGVPPISVAWSLVGTGANGSMAVPVDGPALLPLSAAGAGSFELTVVAEDALHQTSRPASAPVTFAPRLQVDAGAVAVDGAHAVRLNVSADAYGGAPPYVWTVVTSPGARNGSSPSGGLSGPGTFGWNGTYRTAGVLAIDVVVVDAAGTAVSTNLSAPSVAPLRASATLRPLGPRTVRLALAVVGGLGPYVYRWDDSLGDFGNGSVPANGSVAFTAGVAGGGPVTFTVTVTDGLGDVAVAVANATSSGGPTPPPSTFLPEVVAVVGVLGAGAAGAVALRRRERSRSLAAAPPLDPVTVLREVIEPSDGVDRAMVEMLAEERGLEPPVVRATLERLKEDGTVRAGRGFDGEEVLAWVGPPAA